MKWEVLQKQESVTRNQHVANNQWHDIDTQLVIGNMISSMRRRSYIYVHLKKQ